MTINKFRAILRKKKHGFFRMLKPGETIQAHDVLVGRDCYDWVAAGNESLPCGQHETILRLEFDSE